MPEVADDGGIGIGQFIRKHFVKFSLTLGGHRAIVHVVNFEQFANIGRFYKAGFLYSRGTKTRNERHIDQRIEAIPYQTFVVLA